MGFLRYGFVAATGFVLVVACGKSDGDSNEQGDTGGSSGASGASGSGGTGAMRGYHPPDRHVQSCQRLCEREVEAMCSNETTFEKCVEDCNLGILFQACADLWDPVAECVDTTGTLSCSADGGAVLPECIPPYLEYVECLDGLPHALDPECNAHCTAATAAACANGEPMPACVETCRMIAGAFPVCGDTFAQYLTCTVDAGLGCDSEGKPVAPLCTLLFGAFTNCLDDEYAWEPGRGLPQ